MNANNTERENSFWNDIPTSNDNKVLKLKQTNPYNKNSKGIREMQRKMSHYSIKTRNLYNDLITKYSNDNQSPEKEKNESIARNRCESLFNYSKIKKEYLLQCVKEKNEKMHSNELNGCTFKPELYKSNKNFNKKLYHSVNSLNKHNSISNIIDVYERNVHWDKVRQEKVIKAKRKYPEDSMCTYAPKVNHINQEYLSEVFDEEKNIVRQPQNYFFLLRQFKAKKRSQVEEITNLDYLSSSSRNKKLNISSAYLKRFKTRLHKEILLLS